MALLLQLVLNYLNGWNISFKNGSIFLRFYEKHLNTAEIAALLTIRVNFIQKRDIIPEKQE